MLLDIILDLEGGRSAFHKNACELLQRYTAPYLRRWYSDSTWKIC
jgi:hypothetical protein